MILFGLLLMLVACWGEDDDDFWDGFLLAIGLMFFVVGILT